MVKYEREVVYLGSERVVASRGMMAMFTRAMAGDSNPS